jgi:hypothetical protein
MSDLQGRKVFKVFNQEFIVDERYNVTKELGQGAYGIVWYVYTRCTFGMAVTDTCAQCRDEQLDGRRGRHQESHQCLQQEDLGEARSERDQATAAFQGYVLPVFGPGGDLETIY